MSKRGRDEGALFAAPLTPNTASVADERAMRLSKLRVHLNASFLEDLRRKMEQDPARVFDMEVNSYLKYSQKLRRDYADVSERSELVRQTSLAVANAQSPPGECFMFGTGDAGQLGMGEDLVELMRPRLLDTIPGVNAASVIKICCGGMHTLAVCQGGLMYSWGVNDEGALGRVTKKGAADEESKPGLVTLPSNTGGVVDVSTGDSHVAVVTSTGAIVAWGCFRNSSGQWAFTAEEKICHNPIVVYSPDGSEGSNAINVASGTDHVLALTRRGDVYSWGCPEKGRLGRVDAKIADDAEGCRGLEKVKPLIAPAPVPNIPHPASAVVAGDNHSFAICAAEDVVYAWGLNSYGQTGLPYDASNPGSTQTEYFPRSVPSLKGLGIVTGDAGSTHTAMLTNDGKVYTFGRPAYGRLGQLGIDPRDDEPKPRPGLVHGLDKIGRVVAVAAGSSGSNAAVTADGEAYVWGYGNEGNLGRGDDCDDAHVPERLKPTRAMAGKSVVAVSFGGQHAAALCVGDVNGSPGGKRARA